MYISLLMFMMPVIIITIIIVLLLVVISVFSKENNKKITGGQVIVSGVHFLALMAVALSVVQIGFAAIEMWIPDPLTDSSWSFRQIVNETRYALSVLLIVSPLYIFIVRKSAQSSVAMVSWMQKFTASSILLVSGSVLVLSMIFLVYQLLSGSLGLRVFTEIAYPMAIAGGVGAYYYTIARENNILARATKWYVIGVVLVIIKTILWGIVVTGGPVQSRAIRFDERRLSDLSSMQWQIAQYFNENSVLPASLNELQNSLTGYVLPLDPKTASGYGYRIISQDVEQMVDGSTRRVAKFEICATFETERSEKGVSKDPYRKAIPVDLMMEGEIVPFYTMDDTSPYWDHEAEHSCFERTVKEQKKIQ